MGPVPGKPHFFVEAAGVFILPQGKEKDLKLALAAQAAEAFLHELGAIALPFMVWVGIKGDDLSPALISSGVELAHRTCLETCIDPGGAEFGTADGNILIV